MLQINFPQQSNQADWTESIQLLSEDDSQPLWTTPPADLVVTLTVKSETRRGMGDVQIPYISQQNMGPIPVISAASNDGSGLVSVFEAGNIEISVPASMMSNLVGGFYEVYMTMQTGGATLQIVRGILPLAWGG